MDIPDALAALSTLAGSTLSRRAPHAHIQRKIVLLLNGSGEHVCLDIGKTHAVNLASYRMTIPH
jgi:hypothetical protein